MSNLPMEFKVELLTENEIEIWLKTRKLFTAICDSTSWLIKGKLTRQSIGGVWCPQIASLDDIDPGIIRMLNRSFADKMVQSINHFLYLHHGEDKENI